jgi:hypothetical protein
MQCGILRWCVNELEGVRKENGIAYFTSMLLTPAFDWRD